MERSGKPGSKYTKPFRQTVPTLLEYLKGILDIYREGPQVLQEQVQNADDAGATEIIFLYDKTCYPNKKMWSESLREFNGPSIFVYNDAIFEEQDWNNIQNPQRSGKREDKTKIGRFGMGFVSVYHLSDVPSVLSKDQIGFLDPYAKHFTQDVHSDPSNPKEYPGREGLSFNLNSDTYNTFSDQFRPYINPLFNCSESNFEQKQFEGTIFRFPLRNKIPESQNENEILCDTVWNDAKVHRLFQSFKADAQISPLFLKSVEKISFYQKNNAEEEPTLLFQIATSQCTGPGGDCSLKSKRDRFLEAASKLEITSMSCRLNIKVIDDQRRESTRRYFSVNFTKGDGVSEKFTNLVHKLKVLPWVGVAMCTDEDREEAMGRSFCFLPLPNNPSIMSGLPIHVHGYFGLTHDRQRIEWSEDRKNVPLVAEWNQLLVNEVFPEAYVQLIENLIQTTNRGETTAEVVYAAWPKVQDLTDNWKDGVRMFLQCIKEKPVILTSVSGVQKWMKPSEVYIEANQDELVHKILKEKGYPVPATKIPDHVIEAMNWGGFSMQCITSEDDAGVVRRAIRSDPLQMLNREEKMKLLQYILQDRKLHELENIHLLPLADGGFTHFCSNAPTVYIETQMIPRELFPGTGSLSRFAADDLPQILKLHQKGTQLKCLVQDEVPGVLKEMLPRDWMKNEDVVKWTPGGTAGGQQQPDMEWLERLWEWIANQPPKMITKFVNFPLLPLKSCEDMRLARLSNSLIYSEVTTSSGKELAITEAMGRYLQSLGIIVIQDGLPEFITQHPYVDKVVLMPDANGVATVLEARWSQLAIQYVENSANGLRDDIRKLFSQSSLSPKFKSCLSKVPIFQSTDGGFVSVSRCKRMLPAGIYGIPAERFQRRYLVKRDDFDHLAITLGAQLIGKNDILKEILDTMNVQENFYDHEERDNIMKFLLQHREYHELIRTIRFVPTSSDFKSPSELFPPDNKQMESLFKGQSVFPVGEYAKEPLLSCLKEAGMKSSVTAQEILEIAVVLAESQDTEVALALLNHVTENPSLLDVKVSHDRINKELGKFLRDRCWVPVCANRPKGYPTSLAWKGSSEILHRPEDVGLLRYANTLGSVKPLVDVEEVPAEFKIHFGWNDVMSADKYNTVKDVVNHLENVVTASEQVNIPDVQRIIEDIYCFLNKVPTKHLENPKILVAIAKSVWHGNGFTQPDKMAFSAGNVMVDLVPYLYVLPPSLQNQYRSLFTILGVQEQFDMEVLSDVLRCIQKKYQSSDLKKSEAEKDKDLHLACDILKSMV